MCARAKIVRMAKLQESQARRAESLERLRVLAARLPNTTETRTFGNPTFISAKKAFAVLDEYRATHCIWLRVGREARAGLLATPGWFASPYDPKKRALCVDLAAIDWRKFPKQLRASYELARAKPGGA
jgi:hypothetical protein